MDNGEVDKSIEIMERRRRSDRRQRLFQILELILSGKVDSSKTPLAAIFDQKGPRQSYISPKDRGSYNYGYMDLDGLIGPNS